MGIIPACAGSTVRLGRCFPPYRDHPRMCGEHVPPVRVGGAPSGSSPHVRGAPFLFGTNWAGSGIIPACAGSTCAVRTRSGRWRGSSPHVRGAHDSDAVVAFCAGIIPACAGSTADMLFEGDVTRDHPRMCGEHLVRCRCWRRLRGSSPHVRGALRQCGSRRGERGIIPACAGSTITRRSSMLTARDHPRMCGEHFEIRNTLSTA